MKTNATKLVRSAFFFSVCLAAWTAGPPVRAQEAPTLEIAMHPVIRVIGEVGTTYVIESKNGVEDDFWLTRGWIELTTPTAQWTDPVPVDGTGKVYRAVKVTKPALQTIPNMVWIPPGRFVMGSPESERGRGGSEGPQTRVTLTRGFWMGKYEVTQREYMGVTGRNPSLHQPPGSSEDLDRPVESVSWDDAVAYCQALTEQERAAGRLPTGYAYRLPTEAEWEYACRAGTTTRFSFGHALECDDGSGYCVLFDSYMWLDFETARVGLKLPNPWGLHDMHGNVLEWCQAVSDWEHPEYPGGTVVDPQGPTTGWVHILRGGGMFRCGAQNWDALNNRSAARRWIDVDACPFSPFMGFRVLLAPGQ